jgi:RNA 3'-terminal phosphate cyclase (ATP)
MSPRLISIDGAVGEGGGQILRTALALSTVTGQGFEITRIRAGRLRPGLRPQHLAAVRAAAFISNARVGGAFEGSPDLRFEPGAIGAGEFRFEIGTAGAVTLVAQTVLAPLATIDAASRVEIVGGTHVPASPGFHYIERHWLAIVERLGLRAKATLGRAGFYPKGGGEALFEVTPWTRPASLRLEERGSLVGLRGVSLAGRVKGDIAKRQRDAAASLLWEQKRFEAKWDVIEVPSGSPGSFVMLEAVYENGRGAFGVVGERGMRAEAVGEKAARETLRFMEATGAVDGHAADQLVVPLVLARGGGLVSTSEVTKHLQTVVEVVSWFGFKARVEGALGGAGHLEVDAY